MERGDCAYDHVLYNKYLRNNLFDTYSMSIKSHAYTWGTNISGAISILRLCLLFQVLKLFWSDGGDHHVPECSLFLFLSHGLTQNHLPFRLLPS